jgi:hypothetical protein
MVANLIVVNILLPKILTLFKLVFPHILTVALESMPSFYHDCSAVARIRVK